MRRSESRGWRLKATRKTLTWSPQALFPPSLLSDDFFCDMASEDSGRGHDTLGMEETCDEGSGCESKEESDDESVGQEKDVSMLQLMNPSEPEDREDEHEPTSIHTQAMMPTSPPSAQPQLAPFSAIPAPLFRTCEVQRF